MPPTARGDYNCAMCWRENQAGALANYGAIAGYSGGGMGMGWRPGDGRIFWSNFESKYRSWQRDADAVKQGTLRPDQYAALHGSAPDANIATAMENSGLFSRNKFDDLGYWQDANYSTGSEVVVYSKFVSVDKQQRLGTRVLIIGGADLFLSGLSDTANEILKGVNSPNVLHKSAANYPYVLDNDDRFVDDMSSDLAKSYNGGNNIVIYGYSKGGELALKISRRLAEMDTKVLLLITVDAANGPWSDQVDRSVSSNVSMNFNFYQTVPGSFPFPPSFGGPNVGSGFIFNFNMTSSLVNHSNIDEASKLSSIYLINRFAK